MNKQLTMRLLTLVIILIISFKNGISQDDFFLKFKGENYYKNEKLLNTKIKLVSNNVILKELDTKNDNEFEILLNYGKDYDVYFYNKKTQTMHISILANIPKEKQNMYITYQLKIPFFARDSKIIDTNQFINPFHKIIFNGKNKFIDDTLYMTTFLRSLKVKEVNEIKVKETVNEVLQLVGILSFDNEKKSPLKNKKVILLDKSGNQISEAETTTTGLFVFNNINKDNVNELSVVLNETDNPKKEKIKLENLKNELIDFCDALPKNKIIATNKNQLVSKLTALNFQYNIAGKLISENATSKKVAANKVVYLLDSKGKIIQKVKTNQFGSFVFSKILPNNDYTISFDSEEVEIGSIINLYNIKDKFIKKIDSVSGNKFYYRFLSASNTAFNNIIIEDSELKMNVKGRIYGDNKNNSLANLKVLLLNNSFDKIDSAVTNEKGDFLFKYQPYNKEFILASDNENNILESFNNILMFDNADNLVKIVSLIKGHRFLYRQLPQDFSQLSEVYADDPWLKSITKTSKSTESETIIENILFESNKSELLTQSKLTLDKIILVLKTNSILKIELGAHSDSKGADEYNLKLSNQRAIAAKTYIVENGVLENRIKAKGYGETKLINNCGNGSICSEDEHAVNRRLEFKLIYN